MPTLPPFARACKGRKETAGTLTVSLVVASGLGAVPPSSPGRTAAVAGL